MKTSSAGRSSLQMSTSSDSIALSTKQNKHSVSNNHTADRITLNTSKKANNGSSADHRDVEYSVPKKRE